MRSILDEKEQLNKVEFVWLEVMKASIASGASMYVSVSRADDAVAEFKKRSLK